MSSPTPIPTPIPTQTPPPLLSRALDLLDGLLLRTDVPTAVRRDLASVFDDLADVRPPYPPTTPTDSRDQPWPAVIQAAAGALHELIDRPNPTAAPAVMLRHALALRALRDATRNGDTRDGDARGSDGQGEHP